MTKAILLFSSGLDSSIAAHMASKKGLDVIGLHFNQQGKNSKSIEKVKKLAKVLKIKKTYVVNHDNVMEDVLKTCNKKYFCVLCKRFMFRIASSFAKNLKCDYIIDGSNLGQVASQTLENLNITTQATDISVIKPLLCFEKQDIVDIAHEIGTFEISSENELGCKYLPSNPATKSKIEIIEFEESKIDVEKIVENAIKNSYLI